MRGALHSLSMNTEMNKEDLLKILQENRKRHGELFEEASKGFLESSMKSLKLALKRLKEGKSETIQIMLRAPYNHTPSYDTVIGMLERDIRETITLSAVEYRMLVEDEWEWMDDWLLSNSGYSSSTRQLATSKGLT